MDILLVEDEAADVYLIRRAIADCCPQSRVWRVANGREALAFLRCEPPFLNAPTPALILLDLNIPQLDGHDLLLLLRRLGAYQKTPVVIISGSKRAVEESLCRQLGANAYVEKSTDFVTYFGEVKASVRNWLRTDGSPPQGSAYGSFVRSFTIPEGVNAEAIHAKYHNGMLDLSIPLPAAMLPRKVNLAIEGQASGQKQLGSK